MKGKIHIAAVVLFACSLFLAACGGSSGTSGSSGSGSSSSNPLTNVVKPTTLPKITVAFCQSILTVDEANSIMKSAYPQHTATTIRVDSPDSGGGSCNYEYSSYKAIVTIVFVSAFPTGSTIPDINTALQQAQQQQQQDSDAKTTTQSVSGVGDQAVFASASTNITDQPYKFDALDIIWGRVFWDVNVPMLGADASTSDTALLASFTKVAQTVMGRWHG